MKPHYYKDIWVLGPASSHYQGSFPKGLIPRIKKRWWGQKRLWLFSGSFKDKEGVTVDINPDVHPDVVTDAQNLPFEDDSFDFVMADPPYSEEEAQKLYNLPYPSIVKVLNEMARVTCTEGYMILLHRLFPARHPAFNEHVRRMHLEAIVGVAIIAAISNIRALTVWKKDNSIFDFGESSTSGGLIE